ncbi:MAG: ABC transporter permease [Candidatus Buchananbacteria bacterium]|nr:ABC transporter permease [Candidatus Buchananbacteria bacterium]
MNAIYILWLRQIKRYLRSKARIIGALGQPILFFVAFGFGFGPVFQKAGSGNYLEFLGPGIIAMSIVFTAMFSGIEVIWDRQFGFLKETLVAPVSRFNIMLGRTLDGATVAVIQGVVVLILAMLIGFRIQNYWLLPLAFVFMFLIAIFFTALGTAIASRLVDNQAFPLIMNFVVMPLFFLSGALFPLEGVPAGIEWAAKLDPLTYGVDGLRGLLENQYFFNLSIDFTVLVLAALALVALGSWLFSKIEV